MDQNQQPNNPAPPVSGGEQPHQGMPGPGQGQMPPQPPLGQPGFHPQPPRKTNTLAIIALAVTFFFPVIGLVLGVIALSQIKKSGEDGSVLAIIAIVLNALQVIFFIIWFVAIGVIFSNIDDFEDFEDEIQTIELSTESESDSRSSSQSGNARDAERRTDITVIRSQLEAFYAENDYYPAEVSTATLPTVDPAALTPPTSGEDYLYQPSPSGCDECQSYVLSAELEDGTVYSRESLGVDDTEFDPGN